jgi:DNA mismatch repair protein MutS2
MAARVAARSPLRQRLPRQNAPEAAAAVTTVCSPKTLSDLGFDRIVAALAGLCHSERGRALAQEVRPTAVPVELDLRRRLFEQSRRLLEKAGRPDVQFPDLRPILSRVARGEPVLDPHELLEIGRGEAAVRGLAALRTQCDPARDRELLDRLEALVDHAPLVARIDRAVAPDGSVKDDATPELRRLRADLIAARQRIQTDLLAFARQNPDLSQEHLITERNGRYVVPIKSDLRGRVDGLVHDYSSSRRTAFMEPTGFVRENNRIQELAGDEREEVVRILRELTAAVRAAAGSLERNQAEMAELDLCFAIVTMAARQAAELCALSESDVELERARHPLLPKDGTVPIDLRLAADTGLLLISGPNGGGKTVALKTLGLLVLMHQAGLALPVEPRSRLRLFERVAVDIGDPQQLGSDSTYTGHLRTQKALLAGSGEGWLVLLDEVGSGTDPEEGGALGTAVLESLVARGARVVATTHLLGIKAFAHTQDWALLAATELDPDTHEPTFRLIYGVPGRSNALQIAENLGFPPAVLERARGRLQSGQLELEELVRELESARRDLRSAQAAAQRERDQAELARRQYEMKRRDGFASGLADFLSESGALLAKLREMGTRAGGEVGKGELRRLESAVSGLAARARPQRAGRPEQPPAARRREAIAIGDRVLIVPLGVRGEVLDVDEKKGCASVQGPRFAVTAALRDLEWISAAEARAAARAAEPRAALEELRPEKSARMEVDLRGMRVEEGLEAAERYLSDASMTGLPSVRIIHGMGTGKLRAAIQEMLRKHPLVVELRDGGEGEGGLGVTVAKLSE